MLRLKGQAMLQVVGAPHDQSRIVGVEVMEIIGSNAADPGRRINWRVDTSPIWPVASLLQDKWLNSTLCDWSVSS